VCDAALSVVVRHLCFDLPFDFVCRVEVVHVLSLFKPYRRSVMLNTCHNSFDVSFLSGFLMFHLFFHLNLLVLKRRIF